MNMTPYSKEMVDDLILSEASLHEEVAELKDKVMALESVNLRLNKKLQESGNADLEKMEKQISLLEYSLHLTKEKVSLISHTIETLSAERSVDGALQMTVKTLGKIFDVDYVTGYFNKTFRPFNPIAHQGNYSHLDHQVFYSEETRQQPISLEDMPNLTNRIMLSSATTFELNKIDVEELVEHGTVAGFVTKVIIEGEFYGYLLLESRNFNLSGDSMQFLSTLSIVLSKVLAQISLSIKLGAFLQQSLEMSSKDSLTRLFNKHALDAKIRELDKSKQKAVFIFCDLNYLKQFNDNYNHEMGDRALMLFAEGFKGFIDELEGDAYRISGDEFIGVTFTLPNPQQIANFHNNLAILGKEGDLPLPLTTAIGIYKQKEEDTCTEAIKEADSRMYENKRNMKDGRDTR